VQKFTLRPSLEFSYIDSVTARHSSSRRQPTLRRGTRNGITELSQRAPPKFGWAAMALGIGAHSTQLTIKNVGNLFLTVTLANLNRFYSFYIILIVKKFYIRL